MRIINEVLTYKLKEFLFVKKFTFLIFGLFFNVFTLNFFHSNYIRVDWIEKNVCANSTKNFK